MKRVLSLCMTFLLVTGFEIYNTQRALAQEPVLEKYSISHGGNPGTPAAGFGAQVSDRRFGGGNTKAQVKLNIDSDASTLFLRVHRRVRPGQIVFALLVFRTEVRGHDQEGALVYSRDLNGFTFGDSQSGDWSESLNDLPANIHRIEITFFGNYE